MPYWSRDRYAELCPKHSLRTRARLNAAELALPLGNITVPELATPEWRSAFRREPQRWRWYAGHSGVRGFARCRTWRQRAGDGA